jgi:hypothetical protein
MKPLFPFAGRRRGVREDGDRCQSGATTQAKVRVAPAEQCKHAHGTFPCDATAAAKLEAEEDIIQWRQLPVADRGSRRRLGNE